MKKIIAFCGINCSECPAYLATKKNDFEEIKKVAKEWSTDSMSFKPEDIYCNGCSSEGKHVIWWNDCPIRVCCLEKGFENCAYCENYFCDNLRMTFDKTPKAKERLDEIRKRI